MLLEQQRLQPSLLAVGLAVTLRHLRTLARKTEYGRLQLSTRSGTHEVIVDYVTVRELREKSGEIWQRVEGGEEFVVTRNGKPFALLVHTEPQAVESRLKALRLEAFNRAWMALAEQAQASGAAGVTEDEIQAEIDAVRRERRDAIGGA